MKYFEPRRSGPDKLWGKDKTNDHGKWQLVLEPNPGFYYAKVLRCEVGTGTTFVCGADRTATVDFH